MYKEKKSNMSIPRQESATDCVSTFYSADACSCFHIPKLQRSWKHCEMINDQKSEGLLPFDADANSWSSELRLRVRTSVL